MIAKVLLNEFFERSMVTSSSVINIAIKLSEHEVVILNLFLLVPVAIASLILTLKLYFKLR